MKHFSKFILLAWFLGHTCLSSAQEVMASSLDPIPPGWTGKKFELSKSYPSANPSQPQPWKSFNFKTQPLQYAAAVKQYVLEGNVASDWVFKNNTVRKWYHAPAMVWGSNGREFINGMTRERSSRPGELHPNQTSFWQNWAVGFYNPKGGYTLGRVYKVPTNPDPSKATFPEGTVAAKLLFTNAPLSQVPYLQNAFTWQANIHTAQTGTTMRSPGTLRLLQMDVAIKDNRAGATTDWVMLTFVYHNNAPGATPWEKMIPVGIEWGNDPASIASSAALTETWINPAYTSLFTVGTWKIHTGYAGRLNGPVDNPISSCLSCHGTAQYPGVSTGMVPTSAPASITSYFRNINPPALFEDKPAVAEKSLDYSLQLSVGIPLAMQHASVAGVAAPRSSPEPMVKNTMTTRNVEEEEMEIQNWIAEKEAAKPPVVTNPPAQEDTSKPWGWVIGGAAAVSALAYGLSRRKRK